MPRAPKICSAPDCPNVQPCREHKPKARPGRRMPTDWPRTRKRIIARDAGICQLKLPGCTGKATSVDHVVPASKGGTDDDSNLVACCWPCNKRKGARSATPRP